MEGKFCLICSKGGWWRPNRLYCSAKCRRRAELVAKLSAMDKARAAFEESLTPEQLVGRRTYLRRHYSFDVE